MATPAFTHLDGLTHDQAITAAHAASIRDTGAPASPQLDGYRFARLRGAAGGTPAGELVLAFRANWAAGSGTETVTVWDTATHEFVYVQGYDVAFLPVAAGDTD